ncbi:PepSY-like domain-containing protein [Alistipes sp.]|uniref:PepSY-like domain-containing protein n=1 Tax=Alistipes sp. TaxID=1872444 RepID=UPI003AF1DFA3
MKKFLLFIVAAAVGFSVDAAPQKVDFDKLPNNSQEFIQKNFTREKVKDVQMDREASWDKYTVTFNSGTQVSFEGGSGDWSKIVMKDGYVPMTVIPVKIKSYTGANYPRLGVVMIETTADGYKVKLQNGTFLDFDKDGNYVKATK